MELKAGAKINLALDVKGRREDGYHEIDSIFLETELADEITLTENGEGRIILMCSDLSIPNESNLAYKAADAVINKCGITAGVTIGLKKKVPKFAGLGGGSSDAAAVIKGIDALFGLGLSHEDMMLTAGSIGADVPFFIDGGAARVRGTGDEISSIEAAGRLDMVIIKPDVNISTVKAYAMLDSAEITERPDIERLMQGLKAGDMEEICAGMGNSFEPVIAGGYPEIKRAVLLLKEYGAFAAQMSGSGSAVFGLFADHLSARQAYERIKRRVRYGDVFLTVSV